MFYYPIRRTFLLIQAYLERTRLPISDYVNDTKSVVDNVPRLLAAMQFIAMEDPTKMGSFELVCQFSRIRQLLETRSMVGLETDSCAPILDFQRLTALSMYPQGRHGPSSSTAWHQQRGCCPHKARQKIERRRDRIFIRNSKACKGRSGIVVQKGYKG